MKKNILVATNTQKVLSFILEYSVNDFTEKEIEKMVGISKSGTNYALKDLVKAKFLFRHKRGKIHFYSLNRKNPVLKQFKVLKTITQIQSLLQKLKKSSSRVILFGSCSRGEDTAGSDIDLLIVSRSKKQVEEWVRKFRSKRKIQCIIRNNLRYTEMKQKEPVFYGQVNQGIILWEVSSEES